MMWCRNRRAEWLEKELEWERADRDKHIAALIKAHEQELTHIESLNQTIQYEAMRELTETKKAHARELERAISDIDKLREDYRRLQRVMHPALQSIELPEEERKASPPAKRTVAGTPWQRVQAEWQIQQDEEFKKRHLKPAGEPAEGAKPNGGNS